MQTYDLYKCMTNSTLNFEPKFQTRAGHKFVFLQVTSQETEQCKKERKKCIYFKKPIRHTKENRY